MSIHTDSSQFECGERIEAVRQRLQAAKPIPTASASRLKADLDGREKDVLAALGINWPPAKNAAHINCPLPGHDDKHPSWRWDHEARRYFCSCGNGDIFDVIAQMRGGDFKDAAEWVLQDFLNVGAPPKQQTSAAAKPSPGTLVPALRMPNDHELRHPKYGKPLRIWPYHNSESQIVEIRARYDFLDENGEPDKVVLPWVFDGKRWLNKQLPGLRPLYALPVLLDVSEATVVITEGEKDADGGEEKFKAEDLVFTTPSGGCKAHAATDYAPLRGRHVVIWPDNDEPGSDYKAAVATHAQKVGAASIKIVDVPADWRNAKGKAWGLGDPLPDGVIQSDLRRMLDEATERSPRQVNVVQAVVQEQSRSITPEDQWEWKWPSGLKKKNEHNIKLALKKLNISVGFDEFAHCALINGLEGHGPWLNDKALNALYLLIWREYDLKVPRSDFDTIVQDLGLRNRSHPVRAYLSRLVWDGVPRLDGWLSTYLGVADDDAGVTRAIGRVTLIAAVRRVRHPGSKFDLIPVVEGAQGIGKSRAIAMLCPNQEWFTDNLDLSMSPKEIIELTSGKWLVEIGELAGMRRSDVEHVKALVSRQVDEARPAYGRLTEKRPRQFILIGTTNNDQYLVDESGNRRFLPVKATKIDIDGLARDRDQLWAEAAHFEALGESIYMPSDMQQKLTAVQAQREVTDEWDGLIMKWLERTQQQNVTLADAMIGALDMKKGALTQSDQRRAGAAMKRLGWVKAKRSHGYNWWERAQEAK